jgi:hypothetical protein
MGTLSELANAMVTSFQKLDLSARHNFRKAACEKLTGLSYREKNPGGKESQIPVKESQIPM